MQCRLINTCLAIPDSIQNSQKTAKTATNIPQLGILNDLPGTSSRSSVQAQLLSEWRDISARLSKLDAEALRRQAEIATVMAAIAKLQATLPMAQTREADFKNLVGEGFVSSHATQDKTRERVEQQQDLATSQARLAEAQSSLAESQQTQAAYKAETLRLLSDRHATASSKLQQLRQESSKAAQRERQTQLTAPVAGIIQQLAVHSVGGVVTPAQPLMIVVPDSADGAATVTAEISIANQDIGFVNPGQAAEGLAVNGHVDGAGQHDEAQFAVAGGQAFGFAGGQAQRPEADMRPAGAFGRDLDDFTARRMGLGKQGTDHHATFEACASRPSTIARSVS